MPKTILIGIAIALLSTALARAAEIQAKDLERLVSMGTPRIETYYARDTGITGNAHAITQLPNGEIAFLTSNGIFYFDGTNWSALAEGKISWPASAQQLDEECIAIGHSKGIVEIRPDGKGSYEQRQIPMPDQNSDIKGYPVTNTTMARGCLIATKGTELIVFKPDGSSVTHQCEAWPQGLMTIGDEVFALGGRPEIPINRWDWEKQELVPASETLQGIISGWPTSSTPRSEGGSWVLTLENEIIGFDGTRAWTWPGCQELAKLEAQVSSLVETKPGELAIGTSNLGVLLFDRSGHLQRSISIEDGLSDTNVRRIGLDGQNGLWIASRRSVARLDLDFDFLHYGEQHGVPDTVSAIEIFDGRIYLAMPSELLASARDPKKKNETFHRASSIQRITDLYAYDDRLFIAGSVFAVMEKDGSVKVLSEVSGTNLWQPSEYPNLILACTYKGIQRIEKRDGEWVPGPFLDGDRSEVFSIAETKSGVLLGTLGILDVARIRLDATGGSVERLTLKPTPDKKWRSVLNIGGEVYLTNEPMLRWDEASQLFVENDEMLRFPGEKPFGFSGFFGRAPENVFIPANPRRSVTFPRPNRKILGAISTVGSTINNVADCLLYDDDGNAWIGGGFGLVLANSPLAATPRIQAKPRLHRLASVKDHVNLPASAENGKPLVLQPWQDSLTIEAAFPDFASARTSRYSITLRGHDTATADFDASSKREITNLNPGEYLLQIATRRADGQTSETFEMPITLLAHWYERPWAYTLYLAALALLVFAIVKWNARRLEQESLELEKTIAKRTQEVESKNAKLQQQAETLERRNVELAEKSDELQQTTDSLTETLHTLQKTQDQLLATARTAGKAEIATNVLHNVGNVLNSVNVNLASLASKVGDSNVSKLSMLAQLIESQQHDIETFLTQDKRGKAIPEFIISMSRVLQDEMNVMGSIIETMDSDVTHIKSIVAAQQTYAKCIGVIQEFNLAKLCDSAIAIADTKGYARTFEIVNDLPAKLVLQNDKERVLEIILNLISNAKHAILEQEPERGLITISAKKVDDDKCIAITITDNGVGFDESLKSSLFQHGFTTKKNGHGFGLHSCANAASSLGGKLSLDSPGKGKGATATFTLALAN